MDTLGLKIDIVQRSRGQDARKLAAYHLCGRLTAGDRQFDFRRKATEHQEGFVLAPAGAPAWVQDPQRLWDAAEQAERRGDAQPARVLLISLPREVPAEQRADLTRHLLQPYVDAGMCAQVDIHCPRATDGGEQPHAHVLLSMRPLDVERFSARKERGWNAMFRDMQGIRAGLAERMREWGDASGVPLNVDHRSRAARGDTEAPEPTVPRAAWQAWRTAPESTAAEPVRTVLAARAAVREADEAAAEAKAMAVCVQRRHDGAYERARAAYDAERRAAMATARGAEDADWRGRQAGQRAARDGLRQRQRAERSRVYERMGRGLIRGFALAWQGGRHEREQHEQKVAALADRWTWRPRPAAAALEWDDWIRERAREGDAAAAHVAHQEARRLRRRAAADPAAAAREALEHEARIVARLLEAGRPRGESDPAALYRAEAGRIDQRTAEVEQTAREAARRARDDRPGLWRLLMSGEAQQQAARLGAAAEDTARRAAWARGSREADLRATQAAAERAAQANRSALAAWQASAATAALHARQEAARLAMAAVAAGDEETTQSGARGDMAAAGRAAQRWADALPPINRREREPAVVTAHPRTDAIRRLVAAERDAARDPAALAAARQATAAATAGIPGVIDAAARGDMRAALDAAAEWQQCEVQTREAKRHEWRQREKQAGAPRASYGR